MSRRVARSVVPTVLAPLLWACVVVCCQAAPTSQGDSATSPGFATTPSATTGQDPVAGGAWDPANAAAIANGRSGRVLHDPLLGPSGGATGAPGRLATMPPSAVLIEEDPRVDFGDVLRSVVQSTAAAVPWLHLVPPATSERRAGRNTVDAAAADHSARLDDALANRAATARTQAQGGAASGEAVPQLSRELYELARELLANPLTWMFALLVVMVAVTVSVVRSRTK